MRFSEYVKSLMGVANDCWFEMVGNYLMQFVLHCVENPEYLRQPRFNNVRMQTRYWKVMVDRDPSLIYWMLSLFADTLNLRWYFQARPPTNLNERRHWQTT